MFGSTNEAYTLTTIMARPARELERLGWQHAGSGCSRTAYRSPSGCIYKIQSGWDTANLNEHESAEALRSRDIPRGWAVPRTGLHVIDGRDILAMEDCGDVEADVHGADYTTAKEFFGIFDPHSGNIRRKNGILYVIDLGFSNIVGRKF